MASKSMDAFSEGVNECNKSLARILEKQMFAVEDTLGQFRVMVMNDDAAGDLRVAALQAQDLMATITKLRNDI